MKVIDFHDANCKHCYKCVRNCRVKAISVKNNLEEAIEIIIGIKSQLFGMHLLNILFERGKYT